MKLGRTVSPQVARELWRLDQENRESRPVNEIPGRAVILLPWG